MWRIYCQRREPGRRRAEVVVQGDGASGIRSPWEGNFPSCRAILDPWHLWEKVKERARQVWGSKAAALPAAQAVYRALRAFA